LRVGGHLALSLHSSNEPGEPSQWPCHDDSTINIVISISIIISNAAIISAEQNNGTKFSGFPLSFDIEIQGL